MIFKFLGTGGAFDYEYGNSAVWVSLRGKNILVDCGNSVYRTLRENKLAGNIDYILVTHFHDDHVGSLNSIILHHKYFRDPPRRATVLVPNETFRDQLAWFISFALPHPERYVDFKPLSEVEGITAIDTFGMHVKNMPSFGYIFEDEEEIIAYSGDLGNPNILFEKLPQNPQKPVRVFHEMSFFRADGVHSYYQDIMPRLKDYEIYGYHHDPRKAPEDNAVPLVAHYPEWLI
ncbi:MAG: MBL fold metallo-hydrolase [Bacteroidota bacterium]